MNIRTVRRWGSTVRFLDSPAESNMHVARTAEKTTLLSPTALALVGKDGRSALIALPSTQTVLIDPRDAAGDPLAECAGAVLHALLTNDPSAIPDAIETAVLEFQSARPLMLVWSRGKKIAFSVDGVEFAADDDAAFAKNFGRSAAEWRKEILLDPNGRTIGAGADALQAAVMEMFLSPAGRNVVDADRRLNALKERRRAAEAELRSIESSVESAEPAEPAALEDLVFALENERQWAQNLCTQHVGLRLQLESSAKAATPKPAILAVVEEIERAAAELAELERKWSDLKKKTHISGSFAVVLISVVSVASTLGLLMTGRFLGDQALERLAVRLLWICAAGTIAMGIARFLALRTDLAAASALRHELERRADDAKKLAARAGYPIDEIEVTSSKLRAIVDRAAERASSKEWTTFVEKAIASSGDPAAWAKAKERLALTLSSLASNEKETLPIAAAARAADRLMKSWRAAAKDAADAERENAKRAIDRELLTDLLKKIEKDEREIAADLKRSETAKEESATLARLWSRDVCPWLAEVLGECAPTAFNPDLSPRFSIPPTAAVNRICLFLLARLTPRKANPRRIEWSNFVVDAFDRSSDALNDSWAKALGVPAKSPTVLIAKTKSAAAALESVMPNIAIAHVVRSDVEIVPAVDPTADRSEPAAPIKDVVEPSTLSPELVG